jgi:RNA polymerase sigma-70 factor (ECF subfamily)
VEITTTTVGRELQLRRVSNAEMDEPLPPTFAAWLERFRTELVNQAFAILRNKSEAEDVAQESLCEAYECMQDLRNPRQLRVWLRKINHHNALEAIKRRQSDQRKVRGKQESTRLQASVEVGSRLETSEQVAQAVDNLPDDLREIILLRYWERLAVKEIAERVGIPSGTVKSRLFRAEKMLAKWLRKDTDGCD